MSKQHLDWFKLPEKRWRNDPKSGYRSFRDSQRQKLYDAEIIARKLMAEQNLNPSFPSIEEIQKFTDKLISSTWFKKRFKLACDWKVKIVKGRCNSRTAHARYITNTITLPVWAWNKVVVLHEVSHFIAHNYEGHHGRFFARTLLELVGHVLGQEAKEILKKYFKKYKVKYLPKRELSEETREKLRQGFINRVLKQKVEV